MLDYFLDRFKLPAAALATPIEHDHAIVAQVYRIEQAGNAPLILKILPDGKHYGSEVYSLELWRQTLPVPALIDHAPATQIHPAAILLQYLPGTLLAFTQANVQIAYQCGQLLATIHQHRVAGFGFLHQTQAQVTSAIEDFSQTFTKRWQECQAHLPAPLMAKIQDFFRVQVRLLNTVDGPCMIHRDFRPGNILIYNGNVSGVIDCSSARASFAEMDFCGFEHGNWDIGEEGRAAFKQGYAQVRKLPDYTGIMPLLRVHHALGVIGFTLRTNTWQGCNGFLYEYNLNFLLERF